MMHAALLLSLLVQDAQVDYTAPSLYMDGEAFEVTVTLSAPIDAPAAVPAWYLSPAVFALDGTALGERPKEGFVTLLAGQTLTTTFDLAGTIGESEAFSKRAFRLGFAGQEAEPRDVTYLQAAPMGIDFMTLPEEQLGDYQVVMLTVAGTLRMELWPDLAPNHARNFLDLSYTGFYDGSHFHRVIPGFMIQGGGGTRPAPRRVKNEFNERRHVPGVLSMARLGVDTKDADGSLIPANDSATTEFFVMHAVYPSLDGKYTAFGKLLEGIEVVEQIVHTGGPGDPRRDPRASKPQVRQSIHKAVVVKAPKR